MALTATAASSGYHDVFLFDTGAVKPYWLTFPSTASAAARPYDIPNYESEFNAVFTNKTIVTPVMGRRRQHGVFGSEELRTWLRVTWYRPRRDPQAQSESARTRSR